MPETDDRFSYTDPEQLTPPDIPDGISREDLERRLSVDTAPESVRGRVLAAYAERTGRAIPPRQEEEGSSVR